MAKTVNMTTGSPFKHIVTFAFPLLLTNIGQQLYMIVDASIVGRGIGVKALAAVGATDWSYWLILWTVTGLAQGFSTFVAQYFGYNNFKAMNKAIATSVMLCLCIAGFLTIVGLLASKPLLLWLNTPADIIEGATTYLRVMVSGTIIVMFYNMTAAILRAFGDGKTPLIAMIIAALLNIGLDLLFVFVFEWGIFGAALASVLAQAVSFVFCLISLFRVSCVKLDREAWVIDWNMLRVMLLFGIPIALQFIILALGGIILQSSINLQGSAFIAGYTATNKVYGIMECSAMAVGLAGATFFAQNYGARRYKRLKEGIRSAVLIVTVVAVFVITVSLLFKRELLSLFLNTAEAGGTEALDVGAEYLTVMVSTILILYYLHIFRNALQAIGVARWSLVSGIIEFFARVFMAKVAIIYMGPMALFVSEPFAWLGAALSVGIPLFVKLRKLGKDSGNELASEG